MLLYNVGAYKIVCKIRAFTFTFFLLERVRRNLCDDYHEQKVNRTPYTYEIFQPRQRLRQIVGHNPRKHASALANALEASGGISAAECSTAQERRTAILRDLNLAPAAIHQYNVFVSVCVFVCVCLCRAIHELNI
ncbi:unnamed protein product [Trichogramma brassicae]|uniref:Uncharacterized protein n=1 Tax=Trichogramma brassicae TaxID=86971 RepID=A0A6H5IWA5_9HYME|nr:unnamed protein product [Trichogramma brassicae]